VSEDGCREISGKLEKEGLMAKRKVVVRGTGTVGAAGLRLIIQHPQLELVGLLVSGPEKVGIDAGDLAGTGKTGIVGTTDVDAILALEPDCLAQFTNSAMREEATNAEIIPFLLRGINVVSNSQMDVFQPRHGRQEYVEPIARACEQGGASMFSSGVEPGFATTGFPLNLLSIGGRVDEVKVAEIVNISEYGGVESLKLYGFGEPLDYKPPMFTSPIGNAWHRSTVKCFADYMGVKLDEITSTWETAALDFDIEPLFGRIPAGRTAGTRWTMVGMSGGKPFITYTKLERLHDAAGPDWQHGKVGEGNNVFWRTEIIGEPSYVSEIGTSLVPSVAMIPAHVVNAIPTVCDAPPGILDPMRIPPYWTLDVGEGLVRA
jgi:4-hydroxy-tetrahydrodipicolinate reductase